MAKKTLAFVIAIVMIISCAAVGFAEEFELRSGIHFGDTIDDIVAKEKTLEREDDTSNSFNGKIAGYENAQCSFSFDSDTGKLNDMNYTFGTKICTSKDKMQDVYKTLYQSLNRKYGNPLGYADGSCHIITGNAFYCMAVAVALIGGLDGYDADYDDYDEWVIDCGDYSVKIDLVSYYFGNDKDDYSRFVNLSYKCFTDEDLQNARDEKKQEQAEIDNDL